MYLISSDVIILFFEKSNRGRGFSVGTIFFNNNNNNNKEINWSFPIVENWVAVSFDLIK